MRSRRREEGETRNNGNSNNSNSINMSRRTKEGKKAEEPRTSVHKKKRAAKKETKKEGSEGRRGEEVRPGKRRRETWYEDVQASLSLFSDGIMCCCCCCCWQAKSLTEQRSLTLTPSSSERRISIAFCATYIIVAHRDSSSSLDFACERERETQRKTLSLS